MTDSDRDIEAAVATYRSRVLAEAELARADIAELEDHLRVLIDDLRASGVPTAQAIAEAARRLGEPRSIAREHARVRTPFGAKLSRMRAWSIVVLMVPLLASGFANVTVMSPRNQLELVFGAVLALAMAARLTWARPILLGGIGFWTGWYLLALVTFPEANNPAWIVVHAGLLAFLVPWRRGEITAAGAALALQVCAFSAATFALGFQITTPSGWSFAAPAAQVALVAAVIATAGGVLRARWSALASVVSALTLGVAFAQLMTLRFRFGSELFDIGTQAAIGTGAVSAAVGAVLAWRSARSHLGTLRGLAA